MPKSTGPSYNCQAAVETEKNLIVANDVITEPNDQNAFSDMHTQTEQNIGADEERQYDCDSGYHSLTQLEHVETKKVDAVIADPTPKNRSTSKTPTPVEKILNEKRKVERSDFTYHPDGDYYECPRGDRLLPKKPSSSQSTAKVIAYEAPKCQGCQLLDVCLQGKSKSGNRKIHRDAREVLAEQMYRKLQTEEARKRLLRRATTVEPVFGNLKHNLGFRRFNLRGHKQVKGEFSLMCLTHNLNTLFAMMAKGIFDFLRLKLLSVAEKLSAMFKLSQRTRDAQKISGLLGRCAWI